MASKTIKNTNELQREIVYIPIEKLFPHPQNPRTDLGDLSETADSIKAVGILQNLTVVPRDDDTYTIIIGHRRCAAATMAGLTELPCAIVEMTPAEQMRTMLLENMQRSDLTPYDQAHGFQMLIDLGDSVETISEKTGFSTTTVRRRLKMMELDQDKLKEVSGRQLSLTDFDKLAQIEDIGKRNEVLASIGTANFNQSVKSAIKKQNIKKNIPLLKDEIKKLHAKKIERSQTYGWKYERIGDKIDISTWSAGDAIIPAKILSKHTGKKLYYYIEEHWGELCIFIETPRKKPEKRPQSEIDREKYIAETRSKLDELTEIAFKLRQDFVAELTLTKKNERLMLDGAVGAVIATYFSYSSISKVYVLNKLGIEWDHGHAEECKAQLFEGIKKNLSGVIPTIIYSAFEDNAARKFYTTYSREFPRYSNDLRLKALYNWLIALGYEMSDDERGLYDGTHPLLVDKDKSEQNPTCDDNADESEDDTYDGEYGDEE